jgi:small subunit ribosomal protein S16
LLDTRVLAHYSTPRMLAIKLKIIGRRNQRSFRVIVQEAHSKLRGKFIEDLGWFNPKLNQFELNKERIDYWVKNGAQPTKSIQLLLNKSKADSGTETYTVRTDRKTKRKMKGEKKEAAVKEGGSGEEIKPEETKEQEPVLEEKVENTGAE